MVGIVLQCHIINTASTNFGDPSKELTHYKSIELAALNCDVTRFGPFVVSALGLNKGVISLAPMRTLDPTMEGREIYVNTLAIKTAWSPKSGSSTARKHSYHSVVYF